MMYRTEIVRTLVSMKESEAVSATLADGMVISVNGGAIEYGRDGRTLARCEGGKVRWLVMLGTVSLHDIHTVILGQRELTDLFTAVGIAHLAHRTEPTTVYWPTD